ncbi:MAG: hypothetical protein AAF392_03240, partial [Bacteroidota bacterium]
MNFICSFLFAAASLVTPTQSLPENAIIYFDMSNCPDIDYDNFTALEERFAIGAGAGFNLNAIGGRTSFALTMGQIPPHEHHIVGEATSATKDITDIALQIVENYGTNESYYSRNTSMTGEGAEIPILPPYYALPACIKQYTDNYTTNQHLANLYTYIVAINSTTWSKFGMMESNMSMLEIKTSDILDDIDLLENQTAILVEEKYWLHNRTLENEQLITQLRNMLTDLETREQEHNAPVISAMTMMNTTLAEDMAYITQMLANNKQTKQQYLTKLVAIVANHSTLNISAAEEVQEIVSQLGQAYQESIDIYTASANKQKEEYDAIKHDKDNIKPDELREDEDPVLEEVAIFLGSIAIFSYSISIGKKFL